ncbi:uncharacterized protein BT62DRAFT_632679 [Guyanagaster necrorhizus]|uniref:Uncharacterized protein n=1 Tax=Guyanagaster necrorhizus TaxID=856835 RepID=A0A9P8AM09_9AGAR|nr:uncharacterized protein BT62DRAFT_632679 [Guyanagaster necrorhizus MCA 3950]KAG7440239.1 hypothetical protein BT62DRAFT_632679 [Guyanagaster necrorhizus MCA 3950]
MGSCSNSRTTWCLVSSLPRSSIADTTSAGKTSKSNLCVATLSDLVPVYQNVPFEDMNNIAGHSGGARFLNCVPNILRDFLRLLLSFHYDVYAL